MNKIYMLQKDSLLLKFYFYFHPNLKLTSEFKFTIYLSLIYLLHISNYILLILVNFKNKMTRLYIHDIESGINFF